MLSPCAHELHIRAARAPFRSQVGAHLAGTGDDDASIQASNRARERPVPAILDATQQLPKPRAEKGFLDSDVCVTAPVASGTPRTPR
jgi:hypothetical protein